jgi:hypothetical protein
MQKRPVNHRRVVRSAVAAVAAFAGFVPVAHAAIQLVGVGKIASNVTDLVNTGALPALESGSSQNQLSTGSGFTWAGGNTFFGLPDRGPNALPYPGGDPVDNTQSWATRFETLRITVDAANHVVTPTLTHSTVFTTQTGQLLLGLSSLFTGPEPLRFDPESIRISNDKKHVYVSDEYGPFVYQFNAQTGVREKTFTLPAKFAIAHPFGVGGPATPTGSDEISGNTAGRVANKGMEGLAISPDGSTLFGLMQSPLLQDNSLTTDGLFKKNGSNLRIVKIDVATGATQEFVYQLEDKGLATSEIVAVNDHQFLVDERDGNGGAAAVVKHINLIDLFGADGIQGTADDATDVSNVASLPKKDLTGTGIVPVSRALWVDFLALVKNSGLFNDAFPEKIEGMSFGPDLAPGVHSLYVTNDNDFLAANPNDFFVLSFTDADLAGFALPGVVPEPASLSLLGGALSLIRRRNRR